MSHHRTRSMFANYPSISYTDQKIVYGKGQIHVILSILRKYSYNKYWKYTFLLTVHKKYTNTVAHLNKSLFGGIDINPSDCNATFRSEQDKMCLVYQPQNQVLNDQKKRTAAAKCTKQKTKNKSVLISPNLTFENPEVGCFIRRLSSHPRSAALTYSIIY